MVKINVYNIESCCKYNGVYNTDVKNIDFIFTFFIYFLYIIDKKYFNFGGDISVGSFGVERVQHGMSDFIKITGEICFPVGRLDHMLTRLTPLLQ